MSYENAKILYQATQAAEQKFEYFLTGAIGAMFAYTVQNYTPQRLHLTPSTLEPIAIICLAGAFFFGLKRLECLFHKLGISYEQHQEIGYAQVTEEAIRRLVTEPSKYQLRPGSTIESLEKEAQAHRSRAQTAEPLLDSLETTVQHYYTWRNSLMLAGFSLVVAAKIASPYSTHTAPLMPPPAHKGAEQQEVTTKGPDIAPAPSPTEPQEAN